MARVWSRTSLKSAFVVGTAFVATAFAILAGWLTSVGLAIPSGFPNAVVVGTFAVNWAVSPASRRTPQAYRWALYVLVVYLSADILFGEHNLSAYGMGALLTFSFILLFLLGFHTVVRGEALARLLLLLTLFVCGLALGTLVRSFAIGARLRDTPTLFRELGAMGTACNIGAVTAMALSSGSKRRYMYVALACVLSFAVVLTTLKKSILCNGIVWLLVLFGHLRMRRRVKVGLVLGLLCVFLVGLSAVWSELLSNVAITTDAMRARDFETLVRPALYVAGFEVARDHFPFGSGLGTFASVASTWTGYSELYYEYGLANIWAFAPETLALGLTFLYDSFWVHVIAELGFLGSLVYLVLWFLPALYAHRARARIRQLSSGGLSFYVLGVCIVTTVEGFATYNPEIIAFVVFHSGLTGLILGNVVLKKRGVQRVPEAGYEGERGTPVRTGTGTGDHPHAS